MQIHKMLIIRKIIIYKSFTPLTEIPAGIKDKCKCCKYPLNKHNSLIYCQLCMILLHFQFTNAIKVNKLINKCLMILFTSLTTFTIKNTYYHYEYKNEGASRSYRA